MAVTHDVFTDKAKAGKAGRSNANRPTNSAAMCWASAALPPFPNRRALFPSWSALIRTSLTFATIDTRTELRTSSCFVAIEASTSLITRGSKSLVVFINAPNQGAAHVKQNLVAKGLKKMTLLAFSNLAHAEDRDFWLRLAASCRRALSSCALLHEAASRSQESRSSE